MNREDSKTMKVGLYQVLLRDYDEFRLAWGPDSDGDFWVLHNDLDGVDVVSTVPKYIEAIEPVVYIPSNKMDMDALTRILRANRWRPGDVTVALRLADNIEKQLAPPEPPKPPEPTGLGAVVACMSKDGVKGRAVRGTSPIAHWVFVPEAGRPTTATAWSRFKDITVLSHGVDCTCAGPH